MVAPHGAPELHDPAWLRHEYVTNRRSTIAIAHQLGCSPNTIRNRLRAHNIPLRAPGHQPPTAR